MSQQGTVQSQRSASFGHGRFVLRNAIEGGLENIVNDLTGHETTTSGFRSRIFLTQNGRQPQKPQHILPNLEQSMSEVSLLQPAIISQSGVGHKTSVAGKGSQLLAETGLPKIFAKLFISRQQDLQLSKNIEL